MSTGKASFDNVTMEEVETIPKCARAVVKAQNTKKSSNNSTIPTTPRALHLKQRKQK